MILGLDFGGKNIGMAVADENLKVAIPINTIKEENTRRAIEKIGSVCRTRRIQKIILGLPKKLDFTDSPQTLSTKSFGEALREQVGIDVIFRDERYSSKQAENLSKIGKSEKKTEHSVAAQIILQSYLDTV